MLETLAEAAARTFLLAAAVQCVLWLLRVRRASVLLTVWTVVLVASVTMPLVQQVTPLRVSLDAALPEPIAEGASNLLPWPPHLQNPSTGTNSGPEPRPGPVPWLAVTYLVVSPGLLLRVALGVGLSIRLLSRAVPISPGWTRNLRVRISRDVTGPVTVAHVILLPADAPGWPADMRQAVLAHEQAHVERRDFAMLVLSQVNRGLFWFSPVPWWLHRRLVVLTELASDDRAMAHVRDRLRYAEILLEMGRRSGPPSPGPAMARPATLSHRIERILRQQVPSCPASTPRQLLLATSVVGLSLAAAGTMVGPTSQLVVGYGPETSGVFGDAARGLTGPGDTAGLMTVQVQEAARALPVPQGAAEPMADARPEAASDMPRPSAVAGGIPHPATRPSQQTTHRARNPVPRTTPPAPWMEARAAQGVPDQGRQDGEAQPMGPVAPERLPEPTRNTETSLPRSGTGVDLVQLLPAVAVQPRVPAPVVPAGFRDVMGSTCQGTVSIGPNVRSSPDNQPFVVPGQKVAARAQFHFRANGTAWVRFDAFGRQPLDLPVRFTRNGMTWTGEYGVAYTVQASGEGGLSGLAGFFRNDSAQLHLTCARSTADMS